MTQLRKLAAIMFTDIVGYSTLMSKDEKKVISHPFEWAQYIMALVRLTVLLNGSKKHIMTAMAT